MTYSEAFPLWVAEVYRNHGYEPDKWYGSEVAETLYNEAMATYNGPPATMRDYIEKLSRLRMNSRIWTMRLNGCAATTST